MTLVLFQYAIICIFSGVILYKINFGKFEKQVRRQNFIFVVCISGLATTLESIQSPLIDSSNLALLLTNYVFPNILLIALMATEALFLTRFILRTRFGKSMLLFLPIYFVAVSVAVLFTFLITGSIFHDN